MTVPSIFKLCFFPCCRKKSEKSTHTPITRPANSLNKARLDNLERIYRNFSVYAHENPEGMMRKYLDEHIETLVREGYIVIRV